MATDSKAQRLRTSRLVPQIPFVLSWLRHVDTNAADLLVYAPKNVSEREASKAWDQILSSLDTYGDLSTEQLRRICANQEPIVWAKAILQLFETATPQIVTDKAFLMLLGASNKIKNEDDGAQVASKLVPELDQIRISCLEALGEVSALIRDTASDPEDAAMKLGPSFLLESVVPGPEVDAASRIMRLLVVHADSVFGKPGAVSTFDALGARPRSAEEVFDGQSQLSSRSAREQKVANALADAGFM
ncbi:Hypothetical Protein FCC1311_082652 [Hondaea fermentalgiana]|uniref:Uncharacterized protein n=1 Tax=Hondaea fermentalgiana TaxID=2315210 RepID=A0A2R5GMD2_9STRA|nr:Hypothetical Protein FCC1311_082652 [Hondaea fermentalgiana]|eukprot:GBG32040.1 Hypothetical Protein FCC1311_082652 [Hondaea fermentalgiana]